MLTKIIIGTAVIISALSFFGKDKDINDIISQDKVVNVYSVNR